MSDRSQELATMLRTLNFSHIAQSFKEIAVHAVRNGRWHATGHVR